MQQLGSATTTTSRSSKHHCATRLMMMKEEKQCYYDHSSREVLPALPCLDWQSAMVLLLPCCVW